MKLNDAQILQMRLEAARIAGGDVIIARDIYNYLVSGAYDKDGTEVPSLEPIPVPPAPPAPAPAPVEEPPA